MRRNSPLPGLVLLICALGACGGETDGTPARPDAVSSAPSPRTVTAESLMAAVREPGARAVLVNVWATTCVPCVEEMPEIVRLAEAYRDRGLRVVLVSTDFGGAEKNVVPVLTRHGVRFTTYLLDEPIQKLMPVLHGDWSGAIPASVVFDASGEPRDFWEGKASYEEFERRVLEVLGS